MSSSYQLKSHPNKLLYDHLRSVSLLTERRVEEVCSEISTNISREDLKRVAFIVGATHDIGKGTTFFQRYMLNHEIVDPLLKSHSLISSYTVRGQH
jgi:CRISPR-associated endonuclease/helicase Cas3